MTSGAGTPASSAPPASRSQVGGELRARGRRRPTVVEKRSYSRNSGSTSLDSETCTSGQRLADRLADALLVLGVQEREQQADRDGLDLGLAQRVDGLLHAVLVERLELALGPHPLAHA